MEARKVAVVGDEGGALKFKARHQAAMEVLPRRPSTRYHAGWLSDPNPTTNMLATWEVAELTANVESPAGASFELWEADGLALPPCLIAHRAMAAITSCCFLLTTRNRRAPKVHNSQQPGDHFTVSLSVPVPLVTF